MPLTKMTHTYHGDRVLLTASLPREAITVDGPTVELTMDAEEWNELGKKALRARQLAERDLDPADSARRVSRTLQTAARHGLRMHEGQDPMLARRRAVSGVLHHLADMVLAGTLADCQMLYPVERGDAAEPAMLVVCKTTRGSDVEELIPIVPYVGEGAAWEQERPR